MFGAEYTGGGRGWESDHLEPFSVWSYQVSSATAFRSGSRVGIPSQPELPSAQSRFRAPNGEGTVAASGRSPLAQSLGARLRDLRAAGLRLSQWREPKPDSEPRTTSEGTVAASGRSPLAHSLGARLRDLRAAGLRLSQWRESKPDSEPRTTSEGTLAASGRKPLAQSLGARLRVAFLLNYLRCAATYRSSYSVKACCKAMRA
jgi:hypothetical protein